MKTQSTATPVVPTDRFMTPGGQIDFPDDPAKQAALDALWNTNLSGFTAQGITGNPWTTTNSSDQTWYYDPTTTDTSTAAYAQITWSPLPGRITYYFPKLEGTADLFSLADTGKDTSGKSFDQITNNPCDPSKGENQPFGPYGPRGWQDEYCEWSIERDTNGKIVRVDFTCENPEYFNSVWLIDPQRVLEIYQTTLDKPQIKLDDLYLRNASGKPVIDPGTGRPAYDPLNKWNRGSASSATGGGAMHLTSTPNTIQTEIGLGSTATTPRTTGNSDIGKLICCAQYGQIGRNSDPNIGAQVNRIVNGVKAGDPTARATLANPPGLYMQPPDFSRFAAPKGDDPSQFWTVRRGNPALVDTYGKRLTGTFFLHATYMVPASKGYTVSDITIDGIGIQYASQINQTFLMQICGQALPQKPGPSTQPCAGVPKTSLAQPLQLFHKAVFDAMYATTYPTVVDQTANLASNSTMIAPFVRPGDKNVAMTLVASIDARKPPTVSFGPDVTVTVGAITDVNYAIPGNSYPSSNSAIALTISVSPTAAPGLRSCQVTNAGQAPATAMPALLHVVPV